MERVCFNKSFDQYEIQPHKRSLPNDEISPIKRRKSDSPRLTEPSLNSHPSQRNRNPHFANDRLTTLRKQINSDVILTSTVVNPDILENRISPIKHPERKYIVPSRKRNDYPSLSSIRDLKETCATNDGYIIKSSSPKKSGNKIILNNSRSSGSQSTSAYDKSLIKFKVETTVSVPFSKTCDDQNLTTSLRRDVDNIGVPGIKISEKSHEIMKKRYSKRHKYLNPANIFSEKKRHENKDIKTPLDTYDNTSPSISDRTVSKYETYYEKNKGKVKFEEFYANHTEKPTNESSDINKMPILNMTNELSRDYFHSSNSEQRRKEENESYMTPNFHKDSKSSKFMLKEEYVCNPYKASTSSVQDRIKNIQKSSYRNDNSHLLKKQNRSSEFVFKENLVNKSFTAGTSLVQDRIRNIQKSSSRRCSYPLTKNTEICDSEKLSLNHSAISAFNSFNVSCESTEIIDRSKIESSPNNSYSVPKSPNEFNDSMKYWINYGQIIHSLYRKYFSNPVKKEITFSGGQTDSEFNDDDMAMEWDDDDDVNEVLSTKTNVASKEENKDLYIVVDTNIFLSDLNILQEIVRCGSSGGTKPVFYIPWMVLSELDFMKDDKTTSSDLKSRANEAVHFINKTLIEGDRKLIGQNIYDTEKQSYVGKSPDDKILACCLQAREKFHNVIFLSNDVNLRNKLLVNGIPALSTTEMLRNIDDKEEVSATAKLHEKIEKVFETMSNCCSFIICECAEEAYGTIWKNMAMLNNPPWPLKVCLKIFKKYWSSVFREKLLKQCLKAVQQLTEILRELEISKSPDKFEEFVRGCISLCIFLKDLEEFRNFVEGTITDIKSITDCQ